MKSDFESAIIIDDSDDDNNDDDNDDTNNNNIKNIKKSECVNNLENEIIITKKPRTRKVQEPLKKYFYDDLNKIEIGVDEAGRGPLFGRVYTGAVILPKDDSFDHFKMKDSKKFTSKAKIEEMAEYIKKNAVAWYVSFEDEKVIDEINILQATQSAMHKSILEVRKQYIQKMNLNPEKTDYSINLLIDGNYFNPITIVNKKTNKMETIPYTCVEGGDNKFTAIAAASILAKVERDRYIDELCVEHPELIEHYAINSNKGYGAKKHIDGIKAHGITIWHRRSFGICKNYN
jgi:ribonuclease HII